MGEGLRGYGGFFFFFKGELRDGFFVGGVVFGRRGGFGWRDVIFFMDLGGGNGVVGFDVGRFLILVGGICWWQVFCDSKIH